MSIQNSEDFVTQIKTSKELDELFFTRSEKLIDELKSAKLDSDEIIDILSKRYNKALDLIEKLERNQLPKDITPFALANIRYKEKATLEKFDFLLGECKRVYPDSSDIKIYFKVPQTTINGFNDMIKLYSKNSGIMLIDDAGITINTENATYSSIRTYFGEIKLIRE